MKRLWEVAALLVIIAIAAKVVTELVLPLLPYIITGAALATAIGILYHRQRHW